MGYCANIAENKRLWKSGNVKIRNYEELLTILRAKALVEIQKVKIMISSPFYDGKYHPPLLRQLYAAIIENCTAKLR